MGGSGDPEFAVIDSEGADERRDERMGAADISSRWSRLIEELKRSRQALTATVFQEGHPVSFDGDVLEIEFPADAAFHAREARKARHGDALRDVLEEHLGTRPRLEFTVADSGGGAGGGTAIEETRHEPPSVGGPGSSGPRLAARDAAEAVPSAPTERPETREPEQARTSSDVRHRRDADGSAGVPEAPKESETPGGDEVIRDQSEVFEMARLKFGSNGGGG